MIDVIIDALVDQYGNVEAFMRDQLLMISLDIPSSDIDNVQPVIKQQILGNLATNIINDVLHRYFRKTGRLILRVNNNDTSLHSLSMKSDYILNDFIIDDEREVTPYIDEIRNEWFIIQGNTICLNLRSYLSVFEFIPNVYKIPALVKKYSEKKQSIDYNYYMDLHEISFSSSNRVVNDEVFLYSVSSKDMFSKKDLEDQISSLKKQRFEHEDNINSIDNSLSTANWILNFMNENKLDVEEKNILKTKMIIEITKSGDKDEAFTNILELINLTE